MTARESAHSCAARSGVGVPKTGRAGGRVRPRSCVTGAPTASLSAEGAGFGRVEGARAGKGSVRACTGLGVSGWVSGRVRAPASRLGGQVVRIRRNPGRSESPTSHRSTVAPSQPALQPATAPAVRPRRTHARSRSPPHWQGPRHAPRRVRFHPSVPAAAVRTASHVQAVTGSARNGDTSAASASGSA